MARFCDVNKFLKILTTLSYYSTISVDKKMAESNEQDPIHERRRRMNHKKHFLAPNRVEVTIYENFMTLYLKRSTCKYNSYDMVYFRADVSTPPPPRVRKV